MIVLLVRVNIRGYIMIDYQLKEFYNKPNMDKIYLDAKRFCNVESLYLVQRNIKELPTQKYHRVRISSETFKANVLEETLRVYRNSPNAEKMNDVKSFEYQPLNICELRELIEQKYDTSTKVNK